MHGQLRLCQKKSTRTGRSVLCMERTQPLGSLQSDAIFVVLCYQGRDGRMLKCAHVHEREKEKECAQWHEDYRATRRLRDSGQALDFKKSVLLWRLQALRGIL